MMLLRDDGHQVAFLGTAFVVDHHGYLLTAAHLVNNPTNLCVAPTDAGDGFIPMTFERVAAIPARVAQLDAAHGAALLKLEQEQSINIQTPDDFLGTAENVRPGASVMSLGYAFGHDQLHTILTVGGIVSAKILTPNGTHLILFDNMIHDGDIGGPLVHAADGHIVGLVSGRFEPTEVVGGSANWDRSPVRDPHLSYAVTIDYGIALMEQEGLHEQIAG